MKSAFLAVLVFSMFAVSCGGHDFNYKFLPKEKLANLKDGTYNGKAAVGLDQASVQVIVSSNKIVGVEIIDILAFGWRHDVVLTNLAGQLLDKQSLELDNISGATGSVNAFKIAASKALEQAVIE